MVNMSGENIRQGDDGEAVRRLLSDYGRLLDARDGPAWAALFAPDGEWVGGDQYGVIKGRADLAAFMAGAFVDTPPCVHMLGNMALEIRGDEATAWSRWLLIEQRDSGLHMALAGHYADRLVRMPEGWRFQRREVGLDLPVMPG